MCRPAQKASQRILMFLYTCQTKGKAAAHARVACAQTVQPAQELEAPLLLRVTGQVQAGRPGMGAALQLAKVRRKEEGGDGWIR